MIQSRVMLPVYVRSPSTDNVQAIIRDCDSPVTMHDARFTIERESHSHE